MNKKFLLFEDARDFLKESMVRTKSDYYLFIKKQISKLFPYNPDRVYKEQWVSWQEW